MLSAERKFEDVAWHLRARHFADVASALRVRIDSILHRWREQSLEAMPDLDQLSNAEFEVSMAEILEAIAAAMESDDPIQLHSVIAQAPLHGVDRFLQNFTLDTLLAEERILRGAIIVELREHMRRPLAEGEAAALHEMIDLMLDHSVLAFIRRRNQQRDESMQRQMAGVRRLADLGTLVAGVAHDAANLLLPLRMSVDHLKQCDLPDEARSNVELIEQVFRHFQNTIVNLRWLSADVPHRPTTGASLNLYEFVEDFQRFQCSMLPRTIAFECDVAEGLPPVGISQAALSQILFNLIHNSQQAILSQRESGRIALRAKAGSDGSGVHLAVEDDGPGLSPEARERCMEPYFTTRPLGSGLGLALVQALVAGAGGTIEVYSPAHADSHGAMFVVTLHTAAAPTADRDGG